MTDLLEAVTARLRPHLTIPTVERVTVGDAAILVEVRNGGVESAGVAHRPAGEPPMTDDPDVESLLAAATEHRNASTNGHSARAVGIAAMNALSAPLVDWRTGDPMALLADDVERITTVGLFTPAFRKFDDVAVRVIERDPVDDVATSPGVTVRTFTPPETDAAMSGAEVVFVTGSAFIYGGVERYLDAAPPDATVVVIGATASFLPEPLFEAGVDIVAGALVSNRDAVRAAIQRGDCGTDLHDAGLQKVYAAVDRPAGVRLDETNGSETTNL